MQKLPIGKSDYKSIIEDGYYYIDKTMGIKELMDASGEVILLPRPRRFGKTLFQTMLYYFFDINESDESIYKDKAIYKTDTFKNHFGKYPVIYLTFKDIKEPNIELTFQKMYDLIDFEISRYVKDIDKHCDKLNPKELRSYEKLKSFEANRGDYEQSLKILSKLLFFTYNQKAILLIDEYDTPIQSAFLKGYYEDVIDFFKPFLGSVLKDNDRYLKKSVLTGILRVSKESMFSDLNNIDTNTILDNSFSSCFGFTIDETKKMLIDYDLENQTEEVINWYNGYIFGDTTILNPWSLINFTYKKVFNVYWAQTSSNEMIRTLIENSNSFKENLDVLLNGGAIEQRIDSNITFKENNFYFKDSLLYSFLFFSGYLRCNEKSRTAPFICKLSLVNKEIEYIFDTIIQDWIEESFENNKLQMMLKALINSDLKLFERVFSEFVRDTLSFYDVGKKVEAVYHAFLLGLLVNLKDYEIISNKEAGYGRVDIIVVHKTNLDKPAIVMELKTIDDFEEEDKNSALESAVKQIKEKDYISYCKNRGYKNITAFGVVFDGKRVWIKGV
ncbi:MAG: AAA family ATPase [Campylobacterota bacterium]|nr:AAA family ATPase [Campylobacterota bacterium]